MYIINYKKDNQMVLDKSQKKIDCICGKSYYSSYKNRHVTGMKHKNIIKNMILEKACSKCFILSSIDNYAENSEICFLCDDKSITNLNRLVLNNHDLEEISDLIYGLCINRED